MNPLRTAGCGPGRGRRARVRVERRRTRVARVRLRARHGEPAAVASPADRGDDADGHGRGDRGEEQPDRGEDGAHRGSHAGLVPQSELGLPIRGAREGVVAAAARLHLEDALPGAGPAGDPERAVRLFHGPGPQLRNPAVDPAPPGNGGVDRLGLARGEPEGPRTAAGETVVGVDRVEFTVSRTVSTTTAVPLAASTSASTAATTYQRRRGRSSFAGMFRGGGGRRTLLLQGYL